MTAMAAEEFAQERLDTTTKEIGDKILPIDKFLSQPMIVLSTNIEKIYKCGHCDNKHKHDMIVYVPALEKQYFTSARDMKLVK